MDFIDVVYKRKSVRKYLQKEIEREKIEQILRCAMQAPTARNFQEWIFYVIENRDLLNKLALKHPYGKMLSEAAVAIVVCANIQNETNEKYFTQDCAAATQNILLAATDLGIGSVWVSVYPSRADMVSEIVGIKKGDGGSKIVPVSMVALGYGVDREAQEALRVDRFDEKKVIWI